jgi:hypothetical protein
VTVFTPPDLSEIQPPLTLPPGLLPETPEEYRRRGEAADALFREVKRAIAEKER